MKPAAPQAFAAVLLLGLSAILLASAACAPEDSQTTISQDRGGESYSFLVAGHAYGVPGVNNEGVHPPFKSWFPEINSQSIDFGVFAGDTVIESTEQDWDEVQADLAELTAPVHFAVGNHDVGNRQLFVSRYGPTYFSFEHKGDLFIILDSESVNCNIVDEQMAFLQDALHSTTARNVFLFIHKLIWVTEGTPYYNLKHRLNSKGYDFQNNFWTEVVPALEKLDSQIYVVAGDIGVPWAMALFYEKFENIHLIASGMGGSEEENFLTFYAGADNVQIDVQRLDGEPLNLGSIEAYNLDHYAED